jgi:hypothetical protein
MLQFLSNADPVIVAYLCIGIAASVVSFIVTRFPVIDDECSDALCQRMTCRQQRKIHALERRIIAVEQRIRSLS